MNANSICKLLSSLVVVIILAGCNNTDLEAKLSQKESEVGSLKLEINRLNGRVAELEKSEQNLFNKCLDASVVAMDSHDANRERAVNAQDACAQLIKKYPNGQYKDRATESYILMKGLAAYFSGVIAIEQHVNENEFDKAESELNSMKSNLKTKEYERLLSFISKNRDKPIFFASMRDFHKAAVTGMKVGKKYSVYAALMPDGDRLCSELKESSNYKYCGASDTSVTVHNEFYGEQARDFYEMRGQYGCFTVTMFYGGELQVVEYSRGNCS